MAMFASQETGQQCSTLRLDARFRLAIYGVFATLLITGAAWLIADALKNSADGDMWLAIAADLLMVHGVAAMAALILLGALVPVHIFRAWRSCRNRISGVIMVAFNAVLILSSIGLYYLGSQTMRSWASTLHIAFGLALPVMFFVHVRIGRHRTSI